MHVHGVLVMCLAFLMHLIYLWPVVILSYTVNLPHTQDITSTINIDLILPMFTVQPYR